MHTCIFINDSVVEYTVDSMVLLARKRLENDSKVVRKVAENLAIIFAT